MCIGLGILSPVKAWAISVEEAQAQLANAETRMAEIQVEYQQILEDLDQTQKDIDEYLALAVAAQQELQEGRIRLGEMATMEYKTGGVGLVDVILSSESIPELISNINYLRRFEEMQAQEIEAQRQRQEEFELRVAELDAAKDQQLELLAQAEEKVKEAEALVEECTVALEAAEIEAAEAARLKALQEEADRAAEEAANAAQNVGGGSSSTLTPADPGTSEPTEEPTTQDPSTENPSTEDPDNGGGSTTEPEQPADPQGTWYTGTASAYGTKSDGALGSYTATGALVTEDSMGVAIPMSWANYRSYFGRTVEIKYGGMTVFATINDCGYMGGGSRSLDLQPGVWRAFGCSTAYGWGLRTVQYRIL